jgi:glutamate-1-semialdehyde 2,1-aminomutase
MTTLGKYLGGGFTFGAFGGRREFMAAFDREAGGTLTQAGTFNNNTTSMAAAVATLRHELEPDRIVALNERGDRLRDDLDRVLTDSGLPMRVTGLGSMMAIHADDDRVLELLFHRLLADGLYIARRGFIALSIEITDAHCAALVEAARKVSDTLRA